MLYTQIIVNTVLFLIGTLGILINRGNILLILMCIEIMILSVNLNFATFSVYLGDAIGQMFFLVGLTVAAGESAVGLAILIAYFKRRKRIAIHEVSSLRG